ncbi:MAG TPA: hypothetical protein VH414_15835 [Lichenihabitans sp.]|jgi:hypothetical protein|nr:hypothetical protein [Lichenihabitans sp.]
MRYHGDLTIDEAMADPLIRKVMRADRQDPGDVKRLLAAAAHRMGISRADPYGAEKGRPGIALARRLRDCCGAEAYC